MKLRGINRSKNVEVRGRSVGGGRRTGGLGIGAVVLLLVIGYVTGVDVTPLLQGGGQPMHQSAAPMSAAEKKASDFSARVLATTETVWGNVFSQQLGRTYNPPRMVIFSDVTQSACGGASGATGPFYCPADQKAYLDTKFFAQMSQQLGAKGDFAAAYVIAHEVAHHVQNELGILGKVDAARRAASGTEANALTVRLELMADCLSGVWASNVQGLMERGDLEEALNAARMIGDDHLQRSAGRVPQPHTFTHGTSEQRSRWFTQGYDSGLVGSCDTFTSDQI